MEIGQTKRRRDTKKRNPYGNELVVDRITLENKPDSAVGLAELTVYQEIDLVIDRETGWIGDRSELEVEFEPEVKNCMKMS